MLWLRLYFPKRQKERDDEKKVTNANSPRIVQGGYILDINKVKPAQPV